MILFVSAIHIANFFSHEYITCSKNIENRWRQNRLACKFAVFFAAVWMALKGLSVDPPCPSCCSASNWVNTAPGTPLSPLVYAAVRSHCPLRISPCGSSFSLSAWNISVCASCTHDHSAPSIGSCQQLSTCWHGRVMSESWKLRLIMPLQN